MICHLCGWQNGGDRREMGDHIATEHPDAWAMAVDVVVMQLTEGGQLI
jgi:hypothetical protein